MVILLWKIFKNVEKLKICGKKTFVFKVSIL